MAPVRHIEAEHLKAGTNRADVDDMLCLALYSAGRAMTARYRRLLGAHGLTYPQYLVLLVLNETDGVTMGEVGEKLRLESSTLSPLSKRLEGQGLIARQRRADDERTVLLSLTEAGRERCGQIAGVPDQISAATGLSVEAQDQLVAQLRLLETNLDRQN